MARTLTKDLRARLAEFADAATAVAGWAIIPAFAVLAWGAIGEAEGWFFIAWLALLPFAVVVFVTDIRRTLHSSWGWVARAAYAGRALLFLVGCAALIAATRPPPDPQACCNRHVHTCCRVGPAP